MLTTGNIISKQIDDFFYKQKELNIHCLIDKTIINFIETIRKYFEVFDKPLDVIDWRFDRKFYYQFYKGCNLICTKYPALLESHINLNNLLAKFIKFYNITGNDLANLVRNDLDEALLYIALSERYKIACLNIHRKLKPLSL